MSAPKRKPDGEILDVKAAAVSRKSQRTRVAEELDAEVKTLEEQRASLSVRILELQARAKEAWCTAFFDLVARQRDAHPEDTNVIARLVCLTHAVRTYLAGVACVTGVELDLRIDKGDDKKTTAVLVCTKKNGRATYVIEADGAVRFHGTFEGNLYNTHPSKWSFL